MTEAVDETECDSYVITIRITPKCVRLEIRTPSGHEPGGWLALLDVIASCSLTIQPRELSGRKAKMPWPSL